MKKSSANRILYLVQLPPPYHGVSLTNRFVYNSDFINAGFEKKLLRLKFSESIEQLRKPDPGKLWHFTIIKLKLISHLLFFRPGVVYFSFMPVGKGFFRDCVFLFLIKIFRIRAVLHLNNRGVSKHSDKRFMQFLYRMAFRNSVVVHVSPGLLNMEIGSIKNVKPAATFVVPNTTLTLPEKSMRKNDDSFRILFLSNLFPEKGLMILLEAMTECRKHIPGLQLMVYGGGRGEKVHGMYTGFIQQHQMEQVVRLRGPVTPEDLASIYAATDLFVFPSYFKEECFPLVLLEAMQASLPIVATDIGGIPEMLGHEKEALLVSPGNSKDLAKAIMRVYRNPELGKYLGEAARVRFFREFAMEHFEKRMRKVFESCLTPHP